LSQKWVLAMNHCVMVHEVEKNWNGAKASTTREKKKDVKNVQVAVRRRTVVSVA
jgi:hypothetical protein